MRPSRKQQRDGAQWKVARELAEQYRGKLTWHPQSKTWRNAKGKEVTVGELYFHSDIATICHRLVERMPSWAGIIYSCLNYRAIRHITENVKWLLLPETRAEAMQREIESLKAKMASAVAVLGGGNDLF